MAISDGGDGGGDENIKIICGPISESSERAIVENDHPWNGKVVYESLPKSKVCQNHFITVYQKIK